MTIRYDTFDQTGSESGNTENIKDESEMTQNQCNNVCIDVL